MSLDASWTLDIAFNLAQGNAAAVHESCKVRDASGVVHRYDQLPFFIDYPAAGTGPGAYGSPHYSHNPANFGDIGYSYYDFPDPAAVPFYTNAGFGPSDDTFVPADRLATIPRADWRWTTTVPDPGLPDKAPQLTISASVFGYWLDQRPAIEDFYPTTDWNFQPDIPATSGDGINELGTPALVIEPPGGDVREYFINDPALTVAPLGPSFPGAYSATLVLGLPRSAIGGTIGVREAVIGPSAGRTAYVRAASSSIVSASWQTWTPPSTPGVIAVGAARSGVRRSPRVPRGGPRAGVTLG